MLSWLSLKQEQSRPPAHILGKWVPGPWWIPELVPNTLQCCVCRHYAELFRNKYSPDRASHPGAQRVGLLIQEKPIGGRGGAVDKWAPSVLLPPIADFTCTHTHVDSI
jgi:hypothetical protein